MSPLVFLVAAAHATNDLYMGFLSTLYPVIREHFSLSLAMVGTVSMVAGMASALSQPLFGALFDRRGRGRLPAPRAARSRPSSSACSPWRRACPCCS